MIKPLTPKTLEYVETKNGKLRGFCQRGIYHFLNVQYAECERWQNPTPVKPWKGIKNALNFGNRAYADGPFTPWDSCGVAHELFAYDENCLNLNIWSPSIEKNAKKPVMVWIHGGGYATGCDMEMQAHDGENLARFGDVVIVGVNHRLNIFGFCDMSRFGEKYANSGNCGLADLVESLRWVRDNIEAFGGDPDNVTIFGQSGGGGKVTALMQISAADGLFHKAIIMSGIGRMLGYSDNTFSNMVVDGLLEKFNTTSIEPLLDLTAEELMDAYHSLGLAKKRGVLNWHPISNEFYPGYPLLGDFTEHARTIPVMLGSTIAESPRMRIFNKHEKSEEEQLAIVQECFPGQDITKLVELFKQAWPGRCLTDIVESYGMIDMRADDLRFADLREKDNSAPTYVYHFSYEFPHQDGGRNAWHCADIPVVYHNSCIYPENFREGIMGNLEDAMAASWTSFARNGDPNNKYLGVEWPAYKAGDCATLLFDNKIEVRKDFDRELAFYRETMEPTVLKKYTEFTQTIN